WGRGEGDGAVGRGAPVRRPPATLSAAGSPPRPGPGRCRPPARPAGGGSAAVAADRRAGRRGGGPPDAAGGRRAPGPAAALRRAPGPEREAGLGPARQGVRVRRTGFPRAGQGAIGTAAATGGRDGEFGGNP